MAQHGAACVAHLGGGGEGEGEGGLGLGGGGEGEGGGGLGLGGGGEGEGGGGLGLGGGGDGEGGGGLGLHRAGFKLCQARHYSYLQPVRGTWCSDSSNPNCHTHGAGGSGGGTHGWGTPHPMRISRAALGSAVAAPQRSVSTLRATPVLQAAFWVVAPGWPSLLGEGREAQA